MYATVHSFAKEELKDEFLKQAYDMGAAAASEALDEEGAGAPPEGAMPPEGAPAEGEVSEQDILAVLEALVQSGQLPPEEAQQILEQLFGGAGGGAPPMPEGGEAAPAEETPEAKEARTILTKAASVIAALETK